MFLTHYVGKNLIIVPGAREGVFTMLAKEIAILLVYNIENKKDFENLFFDISESKFVVINSLSKKKHL